jgi:dephospho-CoA kinase
MMQDNLMTKSSLLKKSVIFLGGEAGVGKSTVAESLSSRIENISVIDKDEATAFLVNALLEQLGCKSSDRESHTYLTKVKPLEYQQMDSMTWNNTGNSSLIVTAPFFDSFNDKAWIEKMLLMGASKDTDVKFVFITRPSASVRAGIMARGAERDTWKISNYEEYRRNTDVAISSVLNNEEIMHIKFDNLSEIDDLLEKLVVRG